MALESLPVADLAWLRDNQHVVRRLCWPRGWIEGGDFWPIIPVLKSASGSAGISCSLADINPQDSSPQTQI